MIKVISVHTLLCAFLISMPALSLGQEQSVAIAIGFEQYMHARAQLIAGMKNAQALDLALLQYSQDHNDALPPLTDPESVKKVLRQYNSSSAIFIDPETNKPFLYNSNLSKRQVPSIKSPANTVILYALPNRFGKRIVCFLDSHIKVCDVADWKTLKAAQHLN